MKESTAAALVNSSCLHHQFRSMSHYATASSNQILPIYTEMHAQAALSYLDPVLISNRVKYQRSQNQAAGKWSTAGIAYVVHTLWRGAPLSARALRFPKDELPGTARKSISVLGVGARFRTRCCWPHTRQAWNPQRNHDKAESQRWETAREAGPKHPAISPQALSSKEMQCKSTKH